MANNKIFYIADMHFWDRTTFRWDKRNDPSVEEFCDIEAKNAAMIERWNSKVSDRDHVYVLGDTFSCSQEAAIKILKQLRGGKYLVPGNHDRAWVRSLVETGKFGVLGCDSYMEIRDNGRKVVLCHYPIAFWNEQHKGSFHIYGHVHASREAKEFREFGEHLVDAGHLPEFRAINAGAMLCGYEPMTLDELISRDFPGGVLTREEFKEANIRDREKVANADTRTC